MRADEHNANLVPVGQLVTLDEFNASLSRVSANVAGTWTAQVYARRGDGWDHDITWTVGVVKGHVGDLEPKPMSPLVT